MSANFKAGDKVNFKPGPKATANVDAVVEAVEGMFLVTKDAAGKVRKVRPGACKAA